MVIVFASRSHEMPIPDANLAGQRMELSHQGALIAPPMSWALGLAQCGRTPSTPQVAHTVGLGLGVWSGRHPSGVW